MHVYVYRHVYRYVFRCEGGEQTDCWVNPQVTVTRLHLLFRLLWRSSPDPAGAWRVARAAAHTQRERRPAIASVSLPARK